MYDHNEFKFYKHRHTLHLKYNTPTRRLFLNILSVYDSTLHSTHFWYYANGNNSLSITITHTFVSTRLYVCYIKDKGNLS